MPRMTTQAMALNDAYRASGAPTSHPRLSYEKRARKAYSVSTEKRYYTYQGRRGYEFGDAVLHSDPMPYDEAVRVSEHLASAGFYAVVFPHSTDDAVASIMAKSDYREAGRVMIYDRSYTWQGAKYYKVPLDEGRKTEAWKRANEV